MKSLYKLPKLESTRDNRLDIWFVVVLLGIILAIVLVVLIRKDYDTALSKCIDLGYSKEYCEIILR